MQQKKHRLRGKKLIYDLVPTKVIIHKLHGEVSLVEQDTIEYVS